MTALVAAAGRASVSPIHARRMLAGSGRRLTELGGQIDGRVFDGARAPIGERGGAEDRPLGREQR
jgi:hypothetical protein